MNVKTEPVVFLLFAAWAGMNLTGIKTQNLLISWIS